MSRNKVLLTVGSATVMVAVVVAGVLWWSQGRAAAYAGMASHFPDSTAVFAEVRRVGQWMELPAESNASPEPIKSQDPLLGVLSRVWAAERIRPEDLPVVLRDQPLAVGIWKDGEAWKGAGLLTVAPSVKQPLEEFLIGKLGSGEAAGEVEGVKLHRVDTPVPDGDCGPAGALKSLVWGVGDSWAVVASGVEEARQVLSPNQARPLDTDPAFLDAASRFPLEKGGWVFVRSQVLADLAGAKGRPCQKPSVHAPETSGGEPDKGSEEGCCGGVGSILSALVPKEGIPCFALWSSPPATSEGMWELRAWLGADEEKKGLFGIFTGGGAKRPELLAKAPKDGSAYIWSGGEDPARLYKSFMDELARSAPPDRMATVRAAVGAAEGKIGVSIATDILPTLGDEALVVVRAGCGDGETKQPEHFALFVSLRDSRRLQSLLREKIAPSLGLVESTVSGHAAWTWGRSEPKAGEPRPLILISGDELVFTAWPDWALGSGSESAAYAKALGEEGKFAFLAVADPASWGQAGKMPVVVSATRDDAGILIDATFSGQRPKIPFLEPGEKEPVPAPEVSSEKAPRPVKKGAKPSQKNAA